MKKAKAFAKGRIHVDILLQLQTYIKKKKQNKTFNQVKKKNHQN